MVGCNNKATAVNTNVTEAEVEEAQKAWDAAAGQLRMGPGE